MWIQDTVVVALHVHQLAADTFTEPVPPEAGREALVGLIAKVHGAAVCVTVCVRSATVKIPVLGSPLLDATRNTTEPLPVPVAPDVIVIHDTLLFAVHGHPPSAETPTLAFPPAGGTVKSAGSIVNRHGVASCETRTRLSLMRISPSLTDGSGLGAARKSTLPLPCPASGDSAEIQLVGVDTFHAHSASAVTERVPVPPSAPMLEGAASVSWHFGGVGAVVVREEDSQAATAAATCASTSSTDRRHVSGSPSAVRRQKGLWYIAVTEQTPCAVRDVHNAGHQTQSCCAAQQ